MKDKEILELLNEMTIEEKVGQMVQVSGDIFLLDDIDVSTGPLKDLHLSNEMLYNVGSILNIIGSEKVKKVQDEYLSKSRLKIPLLFMDDIINGYKIAFPVPIAQGCSWNTETIKEIAKISAMESSAHGYSANEKEAALNAINAGVDIDMMSSIYANNLKDLCLQNKEIENKVNESVLRILTLKNKLGLFENPYGNINEEKEKTYLMNPTNLEKAKKLTQETFVLLKNKNHILPIKKQKKIALIGPYADNIGISGSWSMFSDRTKNSTILDLFKERFGDNILYAKGCEILRQEEINKILSADGLPTVYIENEAKMEENLIDSAIQIAKKADIIILALGEHYKQSGEACSRSDISLPENQVNLINALHKLSIPMVMLLFNGRPIQLNNVEEKLDAILEVWFPGTTGAKAITEMIFGNANPSGKLTMSFPQNAGQCPIYYNHYNTGRPHLGNYRYVSRYQDIPTESFYPFGYGLSYCNFIYKDLKLDKEKMKKEDNIKVTVKVENQSDYAGYEVVQLYIQDLYGNVVRPVKELKAFKKVFFSPHEVKYINFDINIDMLKFWNDKLEYVAEVGKFKVFAGGDSVNLLEKTFELII